MGSYYREAKVSVALVSGSDPFAEKFTDRLIRKGENDPGRVVVHQCSTIFECKRLIFEGKATAVCLDIDHITQQDVTSFIAETRVTHPLIAFCLIGKNECKTGLSTYHPNWVKKFQHYYKLSSNLSDEDLEENAGLIRDLFIADYVKCKMLGNYETTPGVIVKLRSLKKREIIFFVLVPLVTTLIAVFGPGYLASAAKKEEQIVKAKGKESQDSLIRVKDSINSDFSKRPRAAKHQGQTK